jgi:hypothetical protein
MGTTPMLREPAVRRMPVAFLIQTAKIAGNREDKNEVR